MERGGGPAWGRRPFLGAAWATLCSAIVPAAAAIPTGAAELAPGATFYAPPAAGLVDAGQARAAWDGIAPGSAAGQGGETVLFAHFYTVGEPNYGSAEWVVATLRSGPERLAAQLERFRLQDLAPLGRYAWAVQAAPLLDESAARAVFRANPLFPGLSSPEPVPVRVGEFFFNVRQPADFGGTQVASRQGGQLLYAATTIHDGTGTLILP